MGWRSESLPLTREVAKPQALTEGEINGSAGEGLSPSVSLSLDSSLIRGSQGRCEGNL